MLWNTFDSNREHLNKQFVKPDWIPGSGYDLKELREKADQVVGSLRDQPHILVAARIYELILGQAQIAVDPQDWFADKINHGGIVKKLRGQWQRSFTDAAYSAPICGAWRATPDFCHTSPDWERLLTLGFPGILRDIQDIRQKKMNEGTLNESLQVFYDSCEIVYQAAVHFTLRLAEAIRLLGGQITDPDDRMRMTMSAECLANITQRAPQTLFEALQLAYIYYEIHDEMDAGALDSMGGFDRIFARFYQSDLNSGLFTREQEKELLKFYLLKAGMAVQGGYSSFLGHSFFIGGVGSDGRDITNALTYAVLEAYVEMQIISPKISVRVSKNTPAELYRQIALSIRDKNCHYVLTNDDIGVAALEKIGISTEDAREYAPIGCYEPAVVGHEVGCTGAAGISLAKAVELALFNGIDPLTGIQIGMPTGDSTEFETFPEFYTAVKQQIEYMINQVLNTMRKYESFYQDMSPAPLFSATLEECLETGCGAFGGGARYNNTGIEAYFLGSAVDSITAVRKFVYEYQEIAMSELLGILKCNWSGHELTRLKILHEREKWGNNAEGPDFIACDLAKLVARLVNNQPNGRGGVFKADLFAIIIRADDFGKETGALPDGRRAYEPLSKNLDAVIGMDRGGVTSLINSVTKIDLTDFPNGSVLDIMLHPSAVKGEEGLAALIELIRTYFKQGGFGIQFNIFDAKTLAEAQKYPDKYATLQIRVCGWNNYFVNLTKEQQNDFIHQAEQAGA